METTASKDKQLPLSSRLTLRSTQNELWDGYQRWTMEIDGQTHLLLKMPCATFGISYLQQMAVRVGKQLLLDQISATTSGIAAQRQGIYSAVYVIPSMIATFTNKDT